MKEQERESRLIGIGKFAVGVVMSTACATWAARGVVADLTNRISVVEVRQQFTDSNVRDALQSIQADVRELRQAQLNRPETKQ